MTILVLSTTLAIMVLVVADLMIKKNYLESELERAKNSFRTIILQSNMCKLSEMTFPESIYKEKLVKKKQKNALKVVKKTNSTPLLRKKIKVPKNK